MAKPLLPELHPNAVALTAFRALPDGSGRAYTISEAPSRAHAIKFSLRRAWAVGYVRPSTHTPCDCYAVLDVLDANDEIVQDFCVPSAAAFRWWYRTLDLRAIAEPVCTGTDSR